jgi:drug/metabolite transporter (DMT)-like permease
MSSLGSVVVVVLAVVLLAVAVLLVRSRQVTPWPAIVTSAIASGICFTVGGGDSTRGASEPSVATVVAAVVGILCVAAAILALIPRLGRPPFTRLPTLLASGAVVIAAVGLVVNELVG